MPYTHFDDDDPVGTSTGPSVVATIEANFEAIRDAMIMFGGMPRWNYSKVDGSGSAAYPQYRYQTHYSNSNWKIRGEWSYSSGKPTGVVYDVTSDNWSTTRRIGTRTFTWSSNTLAGTSWSDS